MYHEGDEVFDPQDVDLDDDSSSDSLPCPSCGKHVYDDAEQCPYCGEWIMPLAHAAARRSPVWIVLVVLLVAGMLMMMMR